MSLFFASVLGLMAAAAEPPGTVQEQAQVVAPIRVVADADDKIVHDSELHGTSTSLETVSGTPSLEKILRQHSGVAVLASGGEGVASQFLVRGQDPGQSRFFLDGIPLTDAEFNVSRSYWVPLEMIGTVDVYPGGVPARLAEDGLGGAVEMRSRDIFASGLLSARGGSLGFGRALARADLHRSARLLLSYTRSNEDFRYFDDNGTPLNPADDAFRDRSHNRFERFTVFPRIMIFSDAKHRLRAWSVMGLQKLETPGSIRIPSAADYQETWAVAALQHHYRGATRDHRTSLYVRTTAEKLAILHGGRAGLVVPGDTTAMSVGVQTASEARESDWPSVSLGARWHQFSRSMLEQGRPLQRSDVPVSMWAKYSLAPSLEIQPALYAHHYQYWKNGRSDRGFFLATPRATMEWMPLREWRVRGSFGRFYRAPTLNELYGTTLGIVPSETLQPELAWKAELGVDWSRMMSGTISRISASYTAHWTQAEDLVTFVRTSQDARRATNLASARILGHELSGEMAFRWGLRLESTVQFLHAINLSPIPYQYGCDLPFRPRARGTLGAEIESGRWSAFYRLGLQGISYADLGNQQQLAPFADHALGLSYRSGSLGDWGLEVSNLTDVLTTSVKSGSFSFTEVASGYVGYPVPGRRIYLSWKLEV